MTTRRRCLGRLLRCCLLAALAAPCLVGSAPTAAADGQERAGHTVLVVGDSLAHGLAAGLEIVLAPAPGEVRHADVESLIDIGMGLIPRGGDDVVAMVERRLAGGAAPDVIVLHLGTNDVGMPLGGGPFYGEGWHRRYAERLRALLGAAATAGVPVVWAEVPAIHNRRFADAIDGHIRPRQQAVLDEPDSGVVYVATRALTADDGAYRASRFGQRAPRFRSGDGIHFTGYGYAFVADHVAAAIEAETGLAIRPAPPRPEPPTAPRLEAEPVRESASVPGREGDAEPSADAAEPSAGQAPAPDASGPEAGRAPAPEVPDARTDR